MALGITILLKSALSFSFASRHEIKEPSLGYLFFAVCGDAQQQRLAIIQGLVIAKVSNTMAVLPDLLEGGRRVPMSKWFDEVRLRKELEGLVRFSPEGTDITKFDIMDATEHMSLEDALLNRSSPVVLRDHAHNQNRAFSYWKIKRRVLLHKGLIGMHVDCTLSSFNFKKETRLITLAWMIDNALTVAEKKAVDGSPFSKGGPAGLRSVLCWQESGASGAPAWSFCKNDFP